MSSFSTSYWWGSRVFGGDGGDANSRALECSLSTRIHPSAPLAGFGRSDALIVIREN